MGLEGAEAHYAAYFGQGGCRAFACFLGAKANYTVEVCVVGEDVAYAFAYGVGHGQDVFGELFFEVAVAQGAVVVCLTEEAYYVGC